MVDQQGVPETVLVAEDESIIALAIEDELTDAGYTIAGPFATTSATLNWLSSDTPDLAILDTNLRDGSSRSVAIELIRRRVSFVIYSGYRPTMNTVPEFSHSLWIEKPASPGTLTQALADLPRARIR